MTTIKTHNNIELIALEVPENINKFWIHFESISGETRVVQDTNGLTTWDLCLEEGLHLDKYKILGKLSEISEEECERFVVKVMNNQHYQNYNYKSIVDRWVKTAKESFISLLQSNGIDTNNQNTLLLIEKL